jgi:hypothetical protein
MTWTISASGHTPATSEDPDWHRTEFELVTALAAVLANPKYGTSVSSFGGNHVSGEIHKTNPVLVTKEPVHQERAPSREEIASPAVGGILHDTSEIRIVGERGPELVSLSDQDKVETGGTSD